MLSFLLESAQAGEQIIRSGPKAAAGSLYLIAKQGYPNLCPESKNDSEAIMKIASILSSRQSMINSIDAGTLTEFPLFGVEHYVNTRGYSCSAAKFQGYRLCQQGSSAGITPQLNWICAGTGPKTGECVLVGWYEHDTKNDVYKRKGGQWLTVLGYQLTSSKSCPTVLIVADPDSGKRSWLYFQAVKTGTMVECDSHGRTVRNIYPQGPIYKVNCSLRGQGTTILEGAVRFRVQ